MMANLEYYKVFYHVVKCGSVTQAAGALSLSQPAVSQSLKQLETALGVVLVKRTSHGITPTAEGRELFPMWKRAMNSSRRGKNGFCRCATWNGGKSPSALPI